MSHPEAPILPVNVAQAEYQGLINCSPNDPRDVRKHALAESDYLDIDKMMPADGFRRGFDLALRPRTLHQSEFPARSEQWSGQGDQGTERAHRSCGDLVQTLGEAHVLSPGPHHRCIGKSELGDLLGQPGYPAIHRLDQHKGNVRTRDGQDKTGQSCTRADVANQARSEEGGHDRAVEQVPAPESGEFKRADQAAFFALIGKITCEGARNLYPVPE
jgi:hypothetical protein